MSKPKNCISVTEAKTLQGNWMSTRAVDIERSMGSKDVCAVTFSVEELEEFIDYVKDECDAPNPGIRVYFAAYNNSESDKATVFLCATDSPDGNSNNDYSVDPLNKGSNGWPPNAY